MDSSNLFSHPQKPEHIAQDRDTSDAVTKLVFSDRPDRQSKRSA
jgi:hypothetical protein